MVKHRAYSKMASGSMGRWVLAPPLLMLMLGFYSMVSKVQQHMHRHGPWDLLNGWFSRTCWCGDRTSKYHKCTSAQRCLYPPIYIHTYVCIDLKASHQEIVWLNSSLDCSEDDFAQALSDLLLQDARLEVWPWLENGQAQYLVDGTWNKAPQTE